MGEQWGRSASPILVIAIVILPGPLFHQIYLGMFPGYHGPPVYGVQGFRPAQRQLFGLSCPVSCSSNARWIGLYRLPQPSGICPAIFQVV